MPAVENDLPAPSPRALAAMLASLAPGGRVVRVQPLTGGLDASMHAVDVVLTSGERLQLVVRRYSTALRGVGEYSLERGWKILQLLQQHGFSAPRPLLLDAEGGLLDAPGYVMSRLPGRGDLQPRDVHGYTRQLAETLARLHALPLTGAASAFLAPPPSSLEGLLGEAKLQRVAADPAGAAALGAVRSRWRAAQQGEPIVCHGDYWPGNTMWSRERLTGVVDWDGVCLGSRFTDVAYCRMDLQLFLGSDGGEAPDAPDLFLQAYEHAAGASVPEPAFWDLLAALRPLPDPERWLPTYHGLGRLDLTGIDVRRNLDAFIDAALRRLS